MVYASSIRIACAKHVSNILWKCCTVVRGTVGDVGDLARFDTRGRKRHAWRFVVRKLQWEKIGKFVLNGCLGGLKIRFSETPFWRKLSHFTTERPLVSGGEKKNEGAGLQGVPQCELEGCT